MTTSAGAPLALTEMLARPPAGQTDRIMTTRLLGTPDSTPDSDSDLGADFPDLRRWTERQPAAAVTLRLAALVITGVVLVKADERAAWPLAAVALTASVVWTFAAVRHHRAAVPAALVFGLCGAVMAGADWSQPAGLSFIFMCALYLQASAGGAAPRSASLGPRMIALYAVAAMVAVGACSTLLSGHVADLPWILALTLGGYLSGDARRSRQLALQRAQDLLAMTRRANAEQAHAAALAERGRIARDVHDVLAHSLSGLAIQLEAADALLTEGSDIDAAHTMVVRARRLARDGLSEVRRAVAALRDDVKPPEETLARLVADYGADTGWQASCEVLGGPVPDLAVETAQGLQRVAQEALANARKHAPGAAVDVQLAVGMRELTLTITNGTAAQQAATLAESGGGWGLVGLRERVGLLGGTLAAGEAEEGGWRVIATVPISGRDVSNTEN
ncbi:MAG: two-component sensor histidine kinase [Catenulispora sp.]|nr:two-component sensor histidine kinase [Catenulispora sp.]